MLDRFPLRYVDFEINLNWFKLYFLILWLRELTQATCVITLLLHREVPAITVKMVWEPVKTLIHQEKTWAGFKMWKKHRASGDWWKAFWESEVQDKHVAFKTGEKHKSKDVGIKHYGSILLFYVVYLLLNRFWTHLFFFKNLKQQRQS